SPARRSHGLHALPSRAAPRPRVRRKTFARGRSSARAPRRTTPWTPLRLPLRQSFATVRIRPKRLAHELQVRRHYRRKRPASLQSLARRQLPCRQFFHPPQWTSPQTAHPAPPIHHHPWRNVFFSSKSPRAAIHCELRKRRFLNRRSEP